MAIWQEPQPFNRSHVPYQDGALTFHTSTAPLTGTTTVTIDFTTSLDSTINGKTLVTKREFKNNLALRTAFPLVLVARLGDFTGNTGSSALPKIELTTETAPNELLTGNPRIQASSSIDYIDHSTQIVLFGANSKVADWNKFAVTFTLPAGVTLSSLELFFAVYEHANSIDRGL